MTSQVLAIYFLNDLDHYIKEKLGIQYYIRYQDDFCLFHESKEYLKECLNRINRFLKEEKLRLNAKTRLYNMNNKYIFLGRTINLKLGNYRDRYKKLKLKKTKYKNGEISLYSYVCGLKRLI